jgi:hypothetical protein
MTRISNRMVPPVDFLSDVAYEHNCRFRSAEPDGPHEFAGCKIGVQVLRFVYHNVCDISKTYSSVVADLCFQRFQYTVVVDPFTS